MLDGSRKKRLAFWLALALLLVAGGGWAGYVAGPALARGHYAVRVAERVALERAGQLEERTLESESVRSQGIPPALLFEEAERLRLRFRWGGVLLGLWCGVVTALAMGRAMFPKGQRDFDADSGRCVACGRCFADCPVGLRTGKQALGEK